MPTDFKIVLIGDYAVGKTSLIERISTGLFNERTVATIGASFRVWDTSVKKKNATYASHPNYTLGLWDTAGQERFASLIPMYIRGSHGVLYCWDYNKPFDWDKVHETYHRVKSLSPDCIFCLVFTKIDKSDDYLIQNPRAEFFKVEYNIPLLAYTSSYNGDGVKDFFKNLTVELLKKYENNLFTLPQKDTIKLLPKNVSLPKYRYC
jgi:small GTP-binding protein